MADEVKKKPEAEKPFEEKAKEKNQEEKPIEENSQDSSKNESNNEEKTGKEKSSSETAQEEKDQKEETVPDEKEETPAEETAPPELSETDRLKEENFRLKTQLEATKIGFKPDVLKDAVILAESVVKKDGADITTALQSVAKKYPDWKINAKDNKNKGNFKLGADTSSSTNTNDEKLNQAFGIKKKG